MTGPRPASGAFARTRLLARVLGVWGVASVAFAQAPSGDPPGGAGPLATGSPAAPGAPPASGLPGAPQEAPTELPAFALDAATAAELGVPWADDHQWVSAGLRRRVSGLAALPGGVLVAVTDDGEVQRRDSARGWRVVLSASGGLGSADDIEEEDLLLDAESAVLDFSDDEDDALDEDDPERDPDGAGDEAEVEDATEDGEVDAGVGDVGLPQEVLEAGLLDALCYIIYVGGDVFWGHRFFAVALLPLALLAARALVHGLPRPRLGAAAVVGLFAINVGNIALNRSLTYRGVVSEWGLEVGSWLGREAPEDAVLATNIAGSIPWASGLRTIDTLGLNDVTIAHTEMPRMGRGRAGHEKGNGDYVLTREPDYVIFGSSRGARRPKFVGDRQLYRSDAFHDAYALRVYELESGLRLWLYVRRQSHGGKDLRIQPLVVGVNPFARGRLQLPGGEYEPDDSEGQE